MAPRSLDRYPEIGPKERVRDMEHATAKVRSFHPSACREGSTGAERTFWVGRQCVAHAWPVKAPSGEFWLRLSRKLDAIETEANGGDDAG